MKDGFGIFHLILILGILQGFILTLSLFRKKKKNQSANNFLALFLLLISLTMLGRFLKEFSFLGDFPNSLALPDAIIYLYGPLMYIYLRRLILDEPHNKFSTILYFIPAILFLLFQIPILFNDDHFIKIFWKKHTLVRYIIIEGTAILHNLYFFILQYRLFIAYKKESNNNFSYKQYPSFLVLYLLIAITLIVWIVSYFSWVFGYYNILSAIGYRVIWIVLPFIAYTIGYLAIRNPDFFKMNNKKSTSYRKSISLEENQNISKRILTIMEENKLYKNSEFSLQYLAEILSIDRNKLSQVINSEFKMNFNDWTNNYRINDAKSLLLTSNLSIKEIYYEVGFNSKSTFNSVFKKNVGLTPSGYRNNK